ncbi:MAG: kinase [Candidatus Omnitrophica bacterium]|nr:kinase [Candidatus Omnitrophota bacterium]MBU1997470.1 kinase [Candidatus Omnitrophota bacterium]MBU4333323.1 kinase [Candidatus Omnitrophota bacterium]
MIISRTPFRMSFFGGGTDYPKWFEENGGAVLATTINKYCYITCRYLPPFFKHKSRIIYSQMEHINKIDEIDHPAVREVLRYLKIRQGVEIHHDGDLPARTGLGSSSSFTVGLLNALYALKGKMVSKEQLAKEAIYIEQNKCNENVGCQDQMLAAYGGLNFIEFGGNQHLQVHKVTLSQERVKLLQEHLIMVFTGFHRPPDFSKNIDPKIHRELKRTTSSDIVRHQLKEMSKKKNELKTMHQMAIKALDVLNSGESLEGFGNLLHESWLLKKELSSKITTPDIDNIYDVARRAGAAGGKLLGAGSGGFFLLFAHKDKHKKIREKLKKLLFIPFQFENLGTQIIFYQPNGGGKH